ncbi:MAG TPA: hypothetical protein VFZ21_12530 [Gemmatimonadaceae bacterium]|jgi:hypothetical protein|nr:hypothetical protein [Gemmatimonadaceae bacterium]
MTRRRAALTIRIAIGTFALASWSDPGEAQSYRVRVDARAQAVSFRGLVSDSIVAAQAVPGASGGFETPDGHAVRCGAGEYCFFYRPGPVLRGIPVTTSASVILWGFGVPGLTFRATGRLLADVGGDDVWPGTDPAGQLLEGYLEYQRTSLVARAGRQLVASRLEPLGFDGAWLRYRFDDLSLEVTGYGGWGLAQAAALPVSSPALNPLDEWRPRDRQIVAGLETAWLFREIDLRAEYRRELDPQDYYIVSERAGLSFAAPAWRLPLRVTGGVDYNLAEGHVGSADVRLTYARPRYAVSAGARRYRPFFSLWTLWSAFSPVPHNGVHLSGELRASQRLSLHARGEAYRYEDAEVSTALVPQLEDRGWRASTGATMTLTPQWTVDANVGIERGPGASGRFGDVAVGWVPNDLYAFDLYGGAVGRPLELRYYDATSLWIGGRAERVLGARGTQRRVWADVAFVDDERDRPDASSSSLSQVRLRTGISLTFGTNADRLPLPPATPRRQ